MGVSCNPNSFDKMAWCKKAALPDSTHYRVEFNDTLYDIKAIDHMSYKKRESPDPPFICYLSPNSNNFAADGKIFTVATASQTEIIDAIEKDSFEDFEDCLQDKCAKDVGADYIITCNVRDFENSEVPAITPDDFIKSYR